MVCGVSGVSSALLKVSLSVVYAVAVSLSVVYAVAVSLSVVYAVWCIWC